MRSRSAVAWKDITDNVIARSAAIPATPPVAVSPNSLLKRHVRSDVMRNGAVGVSTLSGRGAPSEQDAFEHAQDARSEPVLGDQRFG